MKLTMKNIGVIRDAEIELDGITILAGLNGTGKSTASKALYGVIAPFMNLSEKVADERANSIGHIIEFDLIDPLYEDKLLVPITSELSAKLADKSRSIPEEYEEWVQLFPEFLNKNAALAKEIFPKFLTKLRNAVNRPDTPYIQYLVTKGIQSVFDGQINTIGSPLASEISLTTGQGTRLLWMKIAANKVIACSEKEVTAIRPIYMEPLHILDAYNLFAGLETTSELDAILTASHSPQTIEEHESRERLLNLISSVIHGKLIYSLGKFAYRDEHFPEALSLRNVASGNKTFAVLQRLVEQGGLRKNTVLIIDEPESNQHPQWQLKLAEILVLLHEELGVRLFLNTHSTYFLRAIEVYSNQHELSNHCHYYLTQAVDGEENTYRIRNVDGKTKLIYHEFYMPYEEL